MRKILPLFIFFSAIPAVANANWITLKNTDSVCDEFLYMFNNLNSKNKREIPIHKIESDKGSDYLYRDSINLGKTFKVDFDNDGDIENAYIYTPYTRYLKGSIMYVYQGDVDVTLDAIGQSVPFNVYPCEYDESVEKVTDCPTISQNADEAGIQIDQEVFRGRYTDISLYRYKNSNYMSLWSYSGNNKHYIGIIKPKKNNTYEPVCLFKPNG